ncbi:NDR1/HIN1-like protein 10 [Typha angustifolia]|uniref:NDR1/HIN1-like protein 10 n=1 Tax=Typha angustifolia TaxID=59011 RepID=UPI003C2B3B7B
MDETNNSGTPTESSPRTSFLHLLSTLVKVFIVVIIVLGFVALILYLFYHPDEMQVIVETASLTRFTVVADTSNSCTFFNLSLTVALRNPNYFVGIHYDRLEADAFSNNEPLGWTTLPAFYQEQKNTDIVTAIVQRHTYVPIESVGIEELKYDDGTGLSDVEVRLEGRVRYRFGAAVTKRHSLRVECPLRLQLITTGISWDAGRDFQRTKCRVVEY